MTPEQLKHFSSEWQNLFSNLQQRGYDVEYDSGIIQIRNNENRLNVALAQGRWVIELEKPYKTPDRTTTTNDTVAINRIQHWLIRAKSKPTEYNFTIKRIYLPIDTYAKFVGLEIKLPG